MPRLGLVKPAHVDQKLLNAFGRAAGADGKVLKEDVEKKIGKYIKDAGKLTDVEIATIDFAAKKYKLTTGAKNELSRIAQEMLGKPVFEWQRSTTNTVDVRLNPALPLSNKGVEKAALDWVLHNVEPVLGADAGKAIPHLEGGNNGESAYTLNGKKAKEAVDLYKALGNSGPGLDDFDPRRHVPILTVGTDDECHTFLAILDKSTGKVHDYGDQNTVDITGMVDEAAFKTIFGGDFKKKFEADDFDSIDGYYIAQYLADGASILATPKSSDEPSYTKASEAAESVPKAMGDRTYDMEFRVDTGLLPIKEQLPEMAKLMMVAGRDEDGGIDYHHDGVAVGVGSKLDAGGAGLVDDIAKAIVESYPQGAAGLPELKKAIEKTIAALGNTSELALYVSTSPVKVKVQVNGHEQLKANDAKAWAFINEKTGVYASFYTRPDMK